MTEIHPIPPIFDGNSIVLILGSFPSVKSREVGFFYGHPQNRFWRTLAHVFRAPVPQTVEEKRAFLLANRVAVWDVIASCEITGSSDASIRNAYPNDLNLILTHAPIKRIYTNGTIAHKLYGKHIEPNIHRQAICLPSTSPANAAWTQERLDKAWRIILKGEEK